MPKFFGENRYKLGLFGVNCAGGVTLSSAPDRWRAEWDDIASVYRLADEAGIEFLLPIAKWHGLGGAADTWGRSYETFTHSAAAGALTKHIGVFVTAHVPIVTPAFAAKAIVTIDHVTHGRAGLNIVCGWNPDEFGLHGVSIDGERRYDQGTEWFRIYAKMLEGGAPFDFKGEFYDLVNVVTNPLPVQKPRPPVMSAAASGPGRDFSAMAANIHFTTIPDIEKAPAVVAAVKSHARLYGHESDVFTQTQMVCRPTRREAEDYYYYFAEEHADGDALAYFKRQREATLSKNTTAADVPNLHVPQNRFTRATGKSYAGVFPGTYPLVGSPDDIVEELARLSATGIAGSTLIFFNYLAELPYFVQEVLPRMERAGLRLPFGQNRPQATP